MTPLAALAAIVEGEDAAVYGYSVAGAHVSGGARTKALAGLAAHRANRDRAAAAIVAAGGTPPPGAIAYDLGGPLASPAQARDLMALVDNRLVAAYADAAAATVDGERRWAARTAAECATRAVGWGAAPQAFPTGT